MRLAENYRSLKKRVRLWWDGEFKVKDSEHVIHFYRERSPWASRIETSFHWLANNLWNVIFLAIGIIGLWLAL